MLVFYIVRNRRCVLFSLIRLHIAFLQFLNILGDVAYAHFRYENTHPQIIVIKHFYLWSKLRTNIQIYLFVAHLVSYDFEGVYCFPYKITHPQIIVIKHFDDVSYARIYRFICL